MNQISDGTPSTPAVSAPFPIRPGESPARRQSCILLVLLGTVLRCERSKANRRAAATILCTSGIHCCSSTGEYGGGEKDAPTILPARPATRSRRRRPSRLARKPHRTPTASWAINSLLVRRNVPTQVARSDRTMVVKWMTSASMPPRGQPVSGLEVDLHDAGQANHIGAGIELGHGQV